VNWLSTLVTSASLAAALLAGAASAQSNTMDNLGYGDIAVYGGGVLRGAATPRIDKLAAEGTRLTNFNVEAQCTPNGFDEWV
jgi:Sulfatase